MADTERLQRVAANLGIGAANRHILICADQTNPKCSTKEEGLEAWDRLKRGLAERGLATGQPCVLRSKSNCLRICEQGPIAVVYPDGVWYHSVTADVVGRIIEEHLVAGRPVEEYVILRAPLE